MNKTFRYYSKQDSACKETRGLIQANDIGTAWINLSVIKQLDVELVKQLYNIEIYKAKSYGKSNK